MWESWEVWTGQSMWRVQDATGAQAMTDGRTRAVRVAGKVTAVARRQPKGRQLLLLLLTGLGTLEEVGVMAAESGASVEGQLEEVTRRGKTTCQSNEASW